jgi:enoyl-CoA hydratase
MQFRYQKTGPIGRITMVNPPTNALTHPFFADKEELRSFFEDHDLKAVILRGQGRHFCSGADPESFTDSFRDTQNLKDALHSAKELLQLISFAPIPVAAVISGSCLGGGLEIALACHFRFAATTAMFGFPECGHSLMPGMGGTVFPQQMIPRRHLIDLILSGRMIGAEEALQTGLVDFVSPGKKVGEEAARYLESLTGSHPPKVIRAVMRSIHNGRRMPMDEALAEETRLFCELAQDVAAMESQRKKAKP